MELASITVEDIRLSELRDACRLWYAAYGRQDDPGMLPRRKDMDPVALPRGLLRHIKLAEHKAGAWHYRLVGTAFRELAGLELEGKTISEVENEAYGRHLCALLDKAVEERRPLLSEADYLGPNRYVGRQVWRLLLPLETDAAADAHVMICAHWVDLMENPPTSVDMVGLETGTIYAIRASDPA